MRGARYQRVRGILFLAVGLGTAGLVLVLWGFGVLDSLERQSIDARFSIRGDRPAPKEIVFVAIDDVTTSYFDKTRWPYPRRYHAKVINRINAGHPRAIAVDIQFTEQTDARDDNALIDSVANAHGVVLSTTETLPNGATRIFGGNDTLRQFGAKPASAPLSDRLRRGDPEGEVLRERAEDAGRGHRRDRDRPAASRPAPSGRRARGSTTPARPGASRATRTRTSTTAASPRAPSGARSWSSAPLRRGCRTSTQTPVDPLMPGGEIQSNAIATVLRGVPLRSSPSALAIFLIVLMSLLIPGVSLGNKLRYSAIAAVIAAVAFAAAAQLSFNHGWILSFVYPLAALALATMGALGVHIVLTAFEREQVRNVFARFVPEAVVERRAQAHRLGPPPGRARRWSARCSSPTCAGSRAPPSISRRRWCST